MLGIVVVPKILLINEHNDFLLADASEVEEFEVLNAIVFMMAQIHQTGNDYGNEQNYDSEFVSEQLEIIKPTISNDQINSDIIFDDPNVEVNDGKVEQDKNAHDRRDYDLELFAKNVHKEAEKQQLIAKEVKQRIVVLTKELEKYKERVRDFESKNANKTDFHNEYIKDNNLAKKLENQF
ncbi:hypothetical protein Tco_0424045 [Tanacetum coccineum]